MSEHRPGPWASWTLPGGRWEVGIHNGPTVAIAFNYEDARLIAAAPEILVALIQIVAYADNSTDPGIVQVARAAIAKATGGE